MFLLNIRNFLLSKAFFILLIPPSALSSEWDKIQTTLQNPVHITVYRDAHCQCCHAWIKHLETHQFEITDRIHPQMAMVKRELGLPTNMASCHTAVVEGYVIEGHVPAEDIKTLVTHKPENIHGLSVPHMPVGTPGMEMGKRKDPFTVFQFDKTGNGSAFSHYQVNENNQYDLIDDTP
ncbi:CopG protein [Methylophaga frappieri]|uniref:CopG protein n=1 Tax=Methylophaga frappieri (strain ATCC BAA-2434 / DSM 25690 / JAM7) TaxID=754477 RepID=I1YHK2_METFJ|nr:DUF411 domain-containing protein [Methylophaga frappieri]AFJ02395.1 CopG protein [Methylophaga frappieri]